MRNLRFPAARTLQAVVLLALFCCVTRPTPLSAQQAAATVPDTSETLALVTAQSEAFQARLKRAGYTCPLPPPRIVVTDIPSFGNYHEATNTLSTSDWKLLQPRERAFFLMLAGPNATEADAHRIFDAASHRWIFIHEMGHWLQHCRGVAETTTPYSIEYGADRIALAYWREADPSLIERMMPIFHGVLDHAPNPVPAGQQVETYFNANYQTLGPSPAYPWFQSRMVVTAFEETPPPSFETVLAETK